MEHSNPNPDYVGKLFHPVHAFQNRQLKDMARFKGDLKDDEHVYMIAEEFPDMNVGGTKPISDAGIATFADYMEFQPPMTAAFLHHMIAAHNGELRIVGQDYLEEVLSHWRAHQQGLLLALPDDE